MLKDFIYNVLVECFLAALRIFKKKASNVILFESVPELDGSPWMIYQELIKRGYGKKYKLVWATDSSYKAPSGILTIPFFGKKTIWQKIIATQYQSSAKIIIDSNRPVNKINPHTIRIFTRHGGTLKKCTDYLHSLGAMDFLLTLSKDLQAIDYQECRNYCVKRKSDVLILGYPANDRLWETPKLDLNVFFQKLCLNHKKREGAKIIGWLPTFRQHRDHSNHFEKKTFPYGIPLIRNMDELNDLNIFLKEKNILLMIQTHHAQMENFSKDGLSNIVYISQELKYEMNISTADLMSSFDALITDYSAAYHEYILLDRPIALSVDDYEDYSKNPGFSFDYFEWIKGVYLHNTIDLIHFINDVANGVDSSRNERIKAKHRIHKYTDNQSTKRVVNFLIEKAKL